MTNNFNQAQKAGLALLLFFGLSSLVLAFPYFNRRISGPFAKEKNSKYLTLEEREKKKMVELKTQDTDNDRLNDYDELYIYRSSPYLADTDSDGFSDADEVSGGSDPNCPKGQDCVGNVASPDSASPSTATTAPPPPADALNSLEALKNLSTDEIRKLLGESGVPADVLKKIDDSTLRAIYEDALKTMAASGTAVKAQAENQELRIKN